MMNDLFEMAAGMSPDRNYWNISAIVIISDRTLLGRTEITPLMSENLEHAPIKEKKSIHPV